MRSLSWKQVHARRVARNHLDDPASSEHVSAVTGDTCGIQAQLLSAAELCLGIRTDATQQEIRDELWERRSIVKTYGMRSTLHLFPAKEVPAWMAAIRASLASSGAWHEAYGLDRTQAEAFIDAVRDALDGRSLSRAELADAVSEAAGPWAGERLNAPWADLIDVAAHSGVLCYGPSRGSKATFVRVDQWTRGGQEVDPGTALSQVVQRYLTAYGPAGHRDFAQWFHMRTSAARKLFESPATGLEQVLVEGERMWMTPGALDSDLDVAGSSVRLLPQYDCYVIGCRQRARFIPEGARRRIATFGRGRLEGPVAVPLLVVDGKVAGMWRRTKRAGKIGVTIETFTKLTKKHLHQLEGEAGRLANFYGVGVTLSFATLD
jgi:uncharacterized protein YcaQ